MGIFGASQSKFIKKEILRAGDTIEFLSKGEWTKKDFSQNQDGSKMKSIFEIDVSLNGGESKIMSINATSGNSLGEKYGSETEGSGWKGKFSKVTFVQMLVAGKVHNVVRLVPLDKDESKVFQGTKPDDIKTEWDT